ncbi:MAG: hypothetical protein COA70_00710 [Planctomycetota bacterium]|nr:MAG: hypothetical protein COA70_00710 [Planctomycetota bacterium]
MTSKVSPRKLTSSVRRKLPSAVATTKPRSDAARMVPASTSSLPGSAMALTTPMACSSKTNLAMQKALA